MPTADMPGPSAGCRKMAQDRRFFLPDAAANALPRIASVFVPATPLYHKPDGSWVHFAGLAVR